MIIAVWMQPPTLRFIRHDMFESLRPVGTASDAYEQPPIEATLRQ